jgi:NADPH:quinone reductase-like Zn-dependent oxidoreductase
MSCTKADVKGNEFAGIVVEAPPTSSFKTGTRVFGQKLGSYAQYICENEEKLREVPRQWTNAQSCAVGASGAISWGSFQRTGLSPGETVLILGASGGLGVVAVQIAKAAGCKVICLAGADEEKIEMLRAIGADEVIDYRDEKWEEKVKKLANGGEGVDVVYDAIGDVERSIRCLRYRGRIVVVGFAARGGNMESLQVNRILLKSASIHGYVSISERTHEQI